ncbi:hypothetical protein ACFLXQ_00770 [Chloroflexota bacterium]
MVEVIRKIKKPVLVVGVAGFLAAILVIFALIEGWGILLLIVLFAFRSLPSILVSLITLIPPVRMWAQSNLIVRVVTLLVVMTPSLVLVFYETSQIATIAHYNYAFIPPMVLPADYKYSNLDEKIQAKYAEKREAIVQETCIRIMVPPPLRRQCYTVEKDVCEFVDQFPGISELIGWGPFLKRFVLSLVFSLPGVVLAGYFTRRKH